MATTDSEASSVLSTLPSRNLLKKYVRGEIPREELSFDDIVSALRNSNMRICVGFQSRDGTHYIVNTDGTLRAVYMGQHGAENRPVSLDEATVDQLLRHSSQIDVMLLKKTRLSESAVSDLV